MLRSLISTLLILPALLGAAEDAFFEGPEQKEAEYGFSDASQPHGIFYPGESAAITLAVPEQPKLTATGAAIEIVAVHTRRQTAGEKGFYSDFGRPRLTSAAPIRVPLDLSAAKDGALVVTLPLPETFGTYALVLVRADGSRTSLGNVLRVLKPTPRLSEIPHLMSGKDWDLGVPSLQARLGVTLVRTELHWGQDGHAERDIVDYARHGIRVMVTTGVHPENKIPYRIGGICAAKDDSEFGAWLEAFVGTHYTDGKTGLWGIELFNEPWEPNGISGWGSDSLRYRDLMKTTYVSAKKANPGIYVLGTSSIMNTEDKLISEGDGTPMMQYVDILTDHYVQPKGAYGGRMAQKWKKLTGETETWGGGSEVLYHQFMMQFIAVGNSFISPVQFQHFAGFEWSEQKRDQDRTWDERFYTAKTVGVGMATWNALIQDRAFAGIAFTDHLPFVFQFGEDQDAHLVMVGRLMGLQTERARDVVWPQHAFAPEGRITIADPMREIEIRDCAGNPAPRAADGSYTVELSATPWFVRAPRATTAIEAIRAGKMDGLRNVEILPGSFAVAPQPGKPAPLTVRLHNLRNAAVSGTLTVTTLAQETPFTVTQPMQMAAGATIALQIPVEARYDGGLPLRFTARIGATEEVWDEVVPCTAVMRSAIAGIDDPAWAKLPSVLIMRPEGAAAGNEIDKIWKPFLFPSTTPDKLPAKRADIRVAWDDGGLWIRGSTETKELGRRPRLETRDDDAYFYGPEDEAILVRMLPWKDFFRPYTTRGVERSQWKGDTHPQTKAEWEAFEKASADPQWPAFTVFLDQQPLAMEYVKNGLAARFCEARIKDPTASLAGLRHAYRPGRDFISELPFCGDSFQVGIDLDRADERFAKQHDLPQLPWKLPDGFMAVADTDYEFSAYLCTDDKPELWCLLAPGVPRSHHFPRHTRGPKGQFPVKDGAVEVRRIGEQNVYLMRLTWAQLGLTGPLEAGTDFGLTCRWNVDGGVEFGADYAATKANGLTLHPYWHAMPSNSVRWTLQR